MSEVVTKGLDNVECQCPKCGTKHMQKMLWIGRGIPKKFCINCRKIRNEIEDIHIGESINWRC